MEWKLLIFSQKTLKLLVAGFKGSKFTSTEQWLLSEAEISRSARVQITRHAFTNHKSQITIHKSQFTIHNSQITNHKLQIANSILSGGYKSQISHSQGHKDRIPFPNLDKPELKSNEKHITQNNKH